MIIFQKGSWDRSSVKKTNMAAENCSARVRKGAKKHCCLGNCTSDSRYADKLTPGTYFINFSTVGKIKETQTEWEKCREKVKTEKQRDGFMLVEWNVLVQQI